MIFRFLSLTLLLGLVAHADVTCPVIFGDHMVLQRDQAVAVWGDAGPGEAVTVEFAGQSKAATADASGKWRVTLDPLAASNEPRTLTVTAINRESKIENLKFQDVLVGEVWFCSGQSNMEKPLGPRTGQKPTDGYEAELTQADCPALRLFQVPHHARAKDGDGTLQWFASSGEALMKTKFSAAAYYFGRELQRELGVPVGLIHSSFGGTRIEAWMPPEAFADNPTLRDLPAQPYQAWVKGVQATELYQSMVAPFIPFGVRGFLWYQGEANCMNAEHDSYAVKQRALIASWRTAWGRPDAPFYFAQLAPFAYSRQKNWEKQLTPLALPALWEAQIATLEMPHTGIIPTADLAGNGRDIHPTNKRDIGLRFAGLALAETYGRKVPAYGPRLRFWAHSEPIGAIVLGFANGTGLHSRDSQPLTGFQIAGEDQQFHSAEVVIRGDEVVASSPQVPKPAAVRFAWDELAMPNLVNAAGLPALPFRTDAWPLVLEVPK